MGKIIGLDIGIASVGWAVLDKDSYKIVEAGSNIFPAAEASKNQERREFRGLRRMTRRRRTRLDDFKKLWKNYYKNEYSVTPNNVTELKVKGLSEQLSELELYTVLYSYLKHRGISYLEDAVDEGKTGSDYLKGLQTNQKEMNTKFPSQIQYERLEKYGCFRGENKVSDDEVLSNVFTTSAYKKEIEELISVQDNLGNELDKDFIKKYFEIFSRKRKYYEGPGNELSRTDYGIYTTKIDENGNYITDKNLFEKLIGKCSVYPEEMRASAASYTAQEFNALNDLNNLIVNGRKLTKEEKISIIECYKTEKTINVRKIIKNVIGENIDQLSGYRMDKNDKELYHTFEVYNKLRKAFEEAGISFDFSREDFDEIGRILTLNIEREGIEDAIRISNLVLSSDAVDVLISVRKKNASLFSKWHSFSLKIMNELIPEMYEQPKNQMELLSDMKSIKSKMDEFKGLEDIPVETIIEDIYNPVVKRSIRITIKIINALKKKYSDIEKIVIEMPRDKNSDEEKERIKKFQKDQENELPNIIKRVKDEYGITLTPELIARKKGLAFKLKLWNEQNGRCPYSGRMIDIESLINDGDLFEVDHIIPLSISFDDSRSNKTLVYRVENQEKKNNTPFMYLSRLNRQWNYDKFAAFIKELYGSSGKDRKKFRKKMNNFLFTEDINKIDVLKGFINRNINDTRYASRVVLNSLQGYFRANDNNVKVSVINGSFTHQMRVNLSLGKDRDESFAHHAVDAMLIALSQMGYDAFRARQKDIVDFETGEIINGSAWENQDEMYKTVLYQEKWKNIKDNIIEAEPNIKYWHKVDKKCNRGLCNQTIYSTRKCDDKIWKVDKLNIRDKDDVKKLIYMIQNGKEDKILMAQNDPKTFANLKYILDEYSDCENPFVSYEKETGDLVRKYSKKHNGPKITYLKYMVEEVNSCIDISHKYGHEKGSKKVFLAQLVPFRTDVYYNNNSGKYYLIGIKQSDIKCKGNQYIIDEEKYTDNLIQNGLLKEGQKIEDLEKLGYLFKFSIFKNDTIEFEKKGELIKCRFLSQNSASKNRIEVKPIGKKDYESRNLPTLSTTTVINKYVKDILGNEKQVSGEKFEIIVDSK